MSMFLHCLLVDFAVIVYTYCLCFPYTAKGMGPTCGTLQGLASLNLPLLCIYNDM